MIHIDRDKFYEQYRKEFGNIRSSDKVNNINTMLAALDVFQHLFNTPVISEQFAYIAATVKHETGDTYSAFAEKRQVKVDTPSRKAVKALQDRYWDSGYWGRGPVQITWLKNYEWAQRATGRPILANPDLLLTDLMLGYEVTIRGMTSGAFTGKTLNHYINLRVTDYVNARRVVNGMDRAELIAGYAEKFERIFKAAIV